MQPILIKVIVSKEKAIRQRVVSWGTSELPLTPEFAALLVAENDEKLTACFLQETHEVESPSLALALEAARATCNKLTHKQVLQDQEQRKKLEKYRNDADGYLRGDAETLHRPPSLIGKDPELDARVNAHTRYLNELKTRKETLKTQMRTAISRGAIAAFHEGLLAQFDDGELRDVEILDIFANLAERAYGLALYRGDHPPLGWKSRRLRAQVDAYDKPTPEQYDLMRAIDKRLVATGDLSTLRQTIEGQTKILVAEKVHVQCTATSRLGTWYDLEEVAHQTVEVTFKVNACVMIKTEHGASIEPVSVTETWHVNFLL